MTEPGGPDVVHFAEKPTPSAGPGQVLIEVEFAGLNFTDTLARRGVPGYASSWPFTPGMEVSGTIAQLGPNVKGFKLGARVISFTVDGGGLAAYVVADSRLTTHIPDELDGAVASTIPLTWATATGLIQRAAPGAGDNVLITSSAGGVGQALAELLPRHQPGAIIGGIGSPSKASSLADDVIPVERGVDFIARAQEAAGGGLDVIFESVGGDVLAESLGAVAPGGSVVSYGGAAGQTDPGLPTPAQLRTGNVGVIGFSIINLTRGRPDKTLGLMKTVLALATQDLVIPQPHVVDWTDAVDEHIQQSQGISTGKTVVRVQ